MPGAVRRDGLSARHLLLAVGLIVSGGLLAVIGGWTGIAIGGGQIALGVATFFRPRSTGPPAGAILLLVPAPLEAARHWTARLPLSCSCARLAHPPGLVSLTGLAVAIDLLVLAFAVWRAAATRRTGVERSSP